MISVLFFRIFSAYTPLSFEIENPYTIFFIFFRKIEKYTKMPVITGDNKKINLDYLTNPFVEPGVIGCKIE